jgi:superfamily II DNA or RNA helicase
MSSEDVVELDYHDECDGRVIADAGVLFELEDYLTFSVPGAQFSNAYRTGRWDGKKRLFRALVGMLQVGLLDRLRIFCEERRYRLVVHDRYLHQDSVSAAQVDEWSRGIGLPANRHPYDYQATAVATAVSEGRGLFVSPTASGKSLIIYLIQRWLGLRTLVIVPRIMLVNQMAEDFRSYGYDREVHRLMGGSRADPGDCEITVATWQTLARLDMSWFDQFDVVVGDEAHGFEADCLVRIMSMTTRCRYKFGFTGTLEDIPTHRLVLEGLFGWVSRVTTTDELIRKGRASPVKIECVVLEHPEDYVAGLHSRRGPDGQLLKVEFQDEFRAICSSGPRLEFVSRLARGLQGNVLVLFEWVEEYGVPLHAMMTRDLEGSGRPCHLVHGGIREIDREVAKRQIVPGGSSIVVASYGTLSTGINAPAIDHIVFATQGKKMVRVLQSIGRGLRLADGKTKMTLWDLSDSMVWRRKLNYSMRHLAERMSIYNNEKFGFRVRRVRL